MNSYKPLFQISLRHDYYEGSSCPDLSIRPTTDCKELLTEYQMRSTTPFTGGIKVEIDVDNASQSPVDTLPEGTKLSFFLDLQNPCFKHFTALDELPADEMHLFSNTTNPADPDHRIISRPEAEEYRKPFALVEIQVTKEWFTPPIQEKKFVIEFKAKAPTSYQPLFQISLLHDYYEGSSCPDLSIRPTPACEKLLKGHRMLAKASPGCIQVKTAVVDHESQKPFLPLSEGTKLSFFLDLQNPCFKHFTKLDKLSPCNMYLFSDFSNTLNQPASEYRIISRAKAGADHKPFALVEIQVKEGLFSTQEKKFDIKFEAVKIKWKYYLIAPNLNKNYDYNIVDYSTNVKNVDGSTNGKEAITFEKVERESPLEDEVAQVLREEFPEPNQTYLFISTNEVPSCAIGRKNIQLIKVKKGEDASTEDLPNPSTSGQGEGMSTEEPPVTLIAHLPNPSTSDQGIKILKLKL